MPNLQFTKNEKHPLEMQTKKNQAFSTENERQNGELDLNKIKHDNWYIVSIILKSNQMEKLEQAYCKIKKSLKIEILEELCRFERCT